MRKSCQELSKECKKYLSEYPNYTTSEKLQATYLIRNLINEFTKCNEFRIINMDHVRALRDVCMRLDCAFGLIYLDFSLNDNWYYNRESLNILKEDCEVYIPQLIKRNIKPYITEGLKYQLSIENRLFKKADNLGNQALSENHHAIFTDTIQGAMWLKHTIKKLGIEANPLKDACKDFSPEELGYVYAQLSDFNRYSSSFDEDAREEIYQVLRNKNITDKKEFIRTICLLGYCNTAEGIIAMMMDMFDICGTESICHMMYEFMIDDGEWKYGISDNYFRGLLKEAREAYNLRKQDIASSKDLKTVKQYMNDAFRNIEKRKSAY